MNDSIHIDLIPGSLVERKVDVLVNVTNASLALEKGAISKAILKSAGAKLQSECKRLYPKGIELGNVATTRAFNLQHVKAIYHIILPTYDDGEEVFVEDLLRCLVTQCLTNAMESNFNSIAFPALGIGYHGYPSKTSAKTMMTAIQTFYHVFPKSRLSKVEIVVFEAGEGGTKVWKDFQEELENIVPNEDEVYPEHCERIVEQSHVVSPQSPQPLKSYMMERFQRMYEQDVRIPLYWTSVRGGERVKRCRRSGCKDFELVDVHGKTEQAVKDLLMLTWEKDKVAIGRDARNLRDLGFSSIKVTRIQRIENIHLYKGYAVERQNLLDKAIKNGQLFVTVGQTKNSSGGVKTDEILKRRSDANELLSDIIPEINEHFFFHGTSSENIEEILSQGLDNRLAGNQAMFGGGIYAAESSTKADQYSDHLDRRKKKGLKMLLVRMSLGDILVCDQGQAFRRAPCKLCRKDKCNCKGHSYDSVLGDRKWIFREFVVYEKRQVYPEYLISYDRV